MYIPLLAAAECCLCVCARARARAYTQHGSYIVVRCFMPFTRFQNTNAFAIYNILFVLSHAAHRLLIFIVTRRSIVSIVTSLIELKKKKKERKNYKRVSQRIRDVPPSIDEKEKKKKLITNEQNKNK